MDFEKNRNQFGNANIALDGYGDSISNPVQIRGIKSTVLGVQAEKLFISNKYGQEDHDWYFVEQELILKDGAFDAITIRLSDSTFEKIYFDIGEFYGKF